MKDNYQFNGRPGMGKIKNSVKWASIVNSSASAFGVDPNLLGAIIEHESTWNLKAQTHYHIDSTGEDGYVYGLGQLRDVYLKGAYATYKDGDETVQIPDVARFLAMKQTQGSKNGVVNDKETCKNYYGDYNTAYYNDVMKRKAQYESYDVPISKDAKGNVDQGVKPVKGVANVRVPVKEVVQNFKDGIVNIPNRLMTLMGVSAIGLIAIIVLISQARINNNETI